MKARIRTIEKLLITIDTQDYINKTDKFKHVNQWAFDNGWGNMRTLPEEIIWPGNPLWPADVKIDLVYSRFVSEVENNVA